MDPLSFPMEEEPLPMELLWFPIHGASLPMELLLLSIHGEWLPMDLLRHPMDLAWFPVGPESRPPGRIALGMTARRPILTAIVALSALLFMTAPALGQESTPLEGIEAIRSQLGVPALAAHGVRWDGDHAITAGPWAVGDRAIGPDGPSGVPATVGDLWHIGSCAKAVTATLLATYVAEGKLAWTDTLVEALPELADEMSETAASATIADLLRHRAGLPPNPTGVLMLRLFEEEARTGREAAILEALAEARDAPGPGEPSRYSNFGYMVAGVIAERLGGRAYEDLVFERVLAPLGVRAHDFGFGPPPAGEDASQPEQPMGHRRRPDESWVAQLPVRQRGQLPSDNPPAFGPAGTMHMSLDAWGRFCMAHARGDDLADGERDALGLRREDYAELHRPVETFACGWVVSQRGWAGDGEGGGRTLSHNGSNTLWFATAWIAPEKDWVMLATTNAAGASAPLACDRAIGVALDALRETNSPSSGGQARPEQGEDESGQ